MRCFLGLLLLVVLQTTGIAYAQDDGTAASSLDEINGKVEMSEGELRRLAGQQQVKETELKDLKRKIDDLKSQEKELQLELANKESERASVIKEIKDTEGQINQIRIFSLKRIRAAYIYRDGMAFQKILYKADSTRLEINAIFLKRIQEFDKMVLSRLAGLQVERDRRKIELEGIIEQQKEIQQGIKLRGKGVQDRILRQETLMKEIKLQKASIQKALLELRAQALRMETVVASLTGAEVEGGEGISETRVSNEDSSGKEAESAVDMSAYAGSGLGTMKGKLDVPVGGRVVQGYGEQRTNEFDDYVLSKGLSFEVDEGEKVAAVADGKVIYAGQMPRLGTVVIVDHGNRSYSLYGRLKESVLQAGTVLKAGDEIGLVGSKDNKGRSFYFEIREQGKTVNPRGYFRNL